MNGVDTELESDPYHVWGEAEAPAESLSPCVLTFKNPVSDIFLCFLSNGSRSGTTSRCRSLVLLSWETPTSRAQREAASNSLRALYGLSL